MSQMCSLLVMFDMVGSRAENSQPWLGHERRVLKRCCTLAFVGRRNKDPDTCYSFWVGATLQILGEFDKVDNISNSMFHASCQFMYGT